jgi:hypothetical protein
LDYDQEQSLVLAKDDTAFLWKFWAEERLPGISQNGSAGMPGAARLQAQIFPVDVQLRAGENQWIMKRRESQFLWSLK